MNRLSSLRETRAPIPSMPIAETPPGLFFSMRE
jgi:hypothetical protein